MKIRSLILSITAMAVLALAVLPGDAVSQDKPLREQLVGTWKIVSVENTRPDGSVIHLFGANPRGIAVFDAHGHTVVVLMRSDRSKFAANNRDLLLPLAVTGIPKRPEGR